MVWQAPDGAAPARLLSGLARRGVTVVLAEDAPTVMRELALAPTLAVVIAEPTRQAQHAMLCAAVRAYYPQTRLWQYESHSAHGRARLAPMNGQTEPTKAPGDATEHAPAAAQTSDPPQSRMAPLTSEELEMLLGSSSEGAQRADA